MILTTWAKRWGIPNDAVRDLQRLYGTVAPNIPAPPSEELSEEGVLSRVKLEASNKRCRVWRNNVGAGRIEDGRFLRWGLANDYAGLNTVIKSGDLIGLRPVLITNEHVGAVIGQFISREIKAANWHYTGTGREPAQLAWIELINSMGGDACFANREGTL